MKDVNAIRSAREDYDAKRREERRLADLWFSGALPHGRGRFLQAQNACMLAAGVLIATGADEYELPTKLVGLQARLSARDAHVS